MAGKLLPADVLDLGRGARLGGRGDLGHLDAIQLPGDVPQPDVLELGAVHEEGADALPAPLLPIVAHLHPVVAVERLQALPGQGLLILGQVQEGESEPVQAVIGADLGAPGTALGRHLLGPLLGRGGRFLTIDLGRVRGLLTRGLAGLGLVDGPVELGHGGRVLGVVEDLAHVLGDRHVGGEQEGGGDDEADGADELTHVASSTTPIGGQRSV